MLPLFCFPSCCIASGVAVGDAAAILAIYTPKSELGLFLERRPSECVSFCEISRVSRIVPLHSCRERSPGGFLYARREVLVVSGTLERRQEHGWVLERLWEGKCAARARAVPQARVGRARGVTVARRTTVVHTSVTALGV